MLLVILKDFLLKKWSVLGWCHIVNPCGSIMFFKGSEILNTKGTMGNQE